MKIRVDEHVSPKIVQIIKVICSRADWEITHVRDYHAARTADETWIPRFASEGGKAIITGDAMMFRRPHQILAVQASGLVCFILSKKWTQARRHEQAANILFWWPQIEKALENSNPGDCWPIPFEFERKNLIAKKIAYDQAARSVQNKKV